MVRVRPRGWFSFCSIYVGQLHEKGGNLEMSLPRYFINTRNRMIYRVWNMIQEHVFLGYDLCFMYNL